MSRSYALVIVLSTLLAACGSAPQKSLSDQGGMTQPATKPSSAFVDSESQKLERIIKTLASNSIYFDYDNYSIKPEYQDVLKKDFDLLKNLPSAKLMLEGYADERGSSEYNLALGQKRAEAVKRALKLLGIPESQLEAVSFGKEKPRGTCHEEKCWAENRRVDFAGSKVGRQ